MKDMRKIIYGCFLISFLCIFFHPQMVEGEEREYTYTDGRATYTYTNTGVLTSVDGVNGDIDIAKLAEKLGVSLTAIGRCAFFDLDYVSSVNLPASVQTIGEYAFCNMDFLTEITYEEDSVLNTIGEHAFAGDKTLTDFHQKGTEADGSFRFPASVNTIAESAFDGANPTSVTIPDRVTRIEDSVFANCKNLTTLQLSDTLTVIGDNAFTETSLSFVAIPEKVTRIGESAFSYIDTLMEVSLPVNTEFVIGTYAFFQTDLKEITLYDGCRQVGEGAFPEDTVIHAKEGSCGWEYAMQNGNRVIAIVEEEQTTEEDNGSEGSQTTEGDNKTEGSQTTEEDNKTDSSQTTEEDNNSNGSQITTEKQTSEEKVVTTKYTEVSSGLKTGTQYIIRNLIYEAKDENTLLFVKPVKMNITKLVIPDTVTIDGKKYPVVGIEARACYKYKKLKQVRIGNKVSVVGKQAFAECRKLQKIEFGEGLTQLGAKCFVNDKKLKTVIIRSKQLKKVGKACMQGTNQKKISVPHNRMKKYQKLFRNSK